MADLNRAVTLASSGEQHRKILSLALTQRGILHRVLGKRLHCSLHVIGQREFFSFRERQGVNG